MTCLRTDKVTELGPVMLVYAFSMCLKYLIKDLKSLFYAASLVKQKPLCSSPKEIMFGRTSVVYSLVFILAAGFARLVKFAPVYNFQNVQQSSMMIQFGAFVDRCFILVSMFVVVHISKHVWIIDFFFKAKIDTFKTSQKILHTDTGLVGTCLGWE